MLAASEGDKPIKKCRPEKGPVLKYSVPRKRAEFLWGPEGGDAARGTQTKKRGAGEKGKSGLASRRTCPF